MKWFIVLKWIELCIEPYVEFRKMYSSFVLSKKRKNVMDLYFYLIEMELYLQLLPSQITGKFHLNSYFDTKMGNWYNKFYFEIN